MEYDKTGCQAPLEAPKLCVNGCGFYGNVTTKNLCSKCHMDLKQKQTEHAPLSKGCVLSGSHGSISTVGTNPVVLDQQACSDGSLLCPTLESSTSALKAGGPMRLTENRKKCSTCKKRIGLTGFTCRCGNTFCGMHRYSDRHGCSYNYRTAARDAIAKANPVVKAQKLNKI